MSRTERKNYRGEEIRDGEHAKRCPEADCDWCGRVWYRVLLDRLWKKELKNWKEDL